MGKSFDNKKKIIFSNINKLVKSEDWFGLSSESIHKKYDNKFGEKEVDNILEKLEAEGSLNKNNLEFEMYYPSDNEEFVLERIGCWSKANLSTIYIIISALWFILLYKVPSVLESIIKDSKTNFNIFLGGFIISLIIIYFLSQIVYAAYIWFREKVDFTKLNKKVKGIIIMGLLIIIASAILYIFIPEYAVFGVSILAIILQIIMWLIGNK